MVQWSPETLFPNAGPVPSSSSKELCKLSEFGFLRLVQWSPGFILRLTPGHISSSWSKFDSYPNSPF